MCASRSRRRNSVNARVPLETVRRIAYSAGVQQVERRAAEYVQRVAGDVVREIWRLANEIAMSNGRRRVLLRDVEVAVKVSKLSLILS